MRCWHGLRPEQLRQLHGVGRCAHRAFGRTDADPREETVNVGGNQHRFHKPLDDPRDDQAEEENQPRSQEMRKEGEDFRNKLVDRSEDLAKPQKL